MGRLPRKPRQVVAALARARIQAQERLSETLAGDPDPTDVHVRSMFMTLRRRARSEGWSWRPQYAWPLLSAARTAKALGIQRISALEFGVAGGNGLVALEAAAEGAESLLGVGIDVIGFDSGGGLPPPTGIRDVPFSLRGGEFAMDEPKLRARLRRATLVLGLVEDTTREFLEGEPAPIGFASFDLDYYSSTMHAFAALEADPARILPRVFCYFDDLDWYPFTDFTGERAAIADFNATHDQRKISPIRGLRYALRSDFRLAWPDMVYIAEMFDHPLYGTPEDSPSPDLSLRD